MLKRVLALTAIATVALAVPASAQTYVQDNSFTNTGGTLTARCYLGTVSFFDQDGNLLGSAESAGGTATFRLPAGTDPLTVQARGTGCDEGTLVLDNQVTRPQPEALPRTGADSSVGLGQAGFALLAAGGITVFLARRRQLAKVEA